MHPLETVDIKCTDKRPENSIATVLSSTHYTYVRTHTDTNTCSLTPFLLTYHQKALLFWVTATVKRADTLSSVTASPCSSG